MSNSISPRLKSDTSVKLSVILITSDTFSSIYKTIGYLQKQTIQADLEIVIVAPSLSALALDPTQLAGFVGYRLVEVGKIVSLGRAYASGIRAATYPLIALAEDHCFPDADWAQALVSAHQRPYAAVGPALRNANPATAISWADMLIAYVQWLDPAVSQVVDFLPGHNSSYKRDLLLGYGDRLDAMLESETLLHWDLRSRGYELYLEATARTAHTNFSQFRPWVHILFRSGRVFGASRAQVEQWSWLKRFAYAAASPLIPLVRMARILSGLNQGGREHIKLAFGSLPMTLLGLIMDGLGQMVGYGMGHGDTLQQYADAEFHRELYLAASDKADLTVSF
ncbi:MAG: hypothetical protein AAF152_00370 [Cyanobacteria bacterium P01_A01_bin.114]